MYRAKNKACILFISGALILTLAGCSAAVPKDNNDDSTEAVPLSLATQQQTERPTEEEVLEAREQALSGMTKEQIQRLNKVIREANYWWENNYLYENIFEKLSDPGSLYWNYFDQTGEIQIGWAVGEDLDIDAICAQEGLNEDAFYIKYGTKVTTNNQYDADDFLAILNELISTVQDETLKTNLQAIRDEAQEAKDKHSMKHANNEYKALHDLDYFLLRYGPTDVGPYVEDRSTVFKYYGTLSSYFEPL